MTATGAADAGTRTPGSGPGAFRAWRRSRPFWGALLMLLAGLELLAIPLSGMLIQGQIRLVIYIGIGGVSGAGIGALLIAAGIAAQANAAHRAFYGLAGIILGITSFPASNLGGFFIGMLLAIIGGALSFAWSPASPPPAPWPAAPDGTRAVRTAPADDDPPRRPPGNSGPGSGPGFGRPGSRMLALAGLPCLIFCAPQAPPATSPAHPVSAKAGNDGLLPQAAPSSGSTKTPPGSPARPSGNGTAANAKAARKNAPATQAKPPPGLVAPSATSTLSARSSTLTKLNFAGVTTLPVGGGGSEKVLKFTATSARLTAVGITVTQDGKSVTTTTSSLSFPDGMTLYTTRMCGQVEGIAPATCFTPDTASQVTLKLASALGQATPVTMTSVTADQFLNVSGTSRWGTLTMETG